MVKFSANWDDMNKITYYSCWVLIVLLTLIWMAGAIFYPRNFEQKQLKMAWSNYTFDPKSQNVLEIYHVKDFCQKMLF